jgi:hypothetical protein
MLRRFIPKQRTGLTQDTHHPPPLELKIFD